MNRQVAVSWFFILATVVFLQTPPYKATKKLPADSGPDLPLQLVGKYIVGVQQLLGQRPEMATRFKQMARDLQKNQSTRKQVWVIPILVELSGREVALLELKQLAAGSGDASANRDLSLLTQLYRDGESSLSPQQRLSIKRNGWLGQLALSQSQPASDQARREVLQTAFRTVLLLGIVMTGMLAAVAAGFVVLTIAVVFRAKGRLRSRLMMPAIPGIPLLQAFAIYLTGYAALPAMGAWLFPKFRILGFLLAILAVLLALLWPRFMGWDWQNYRTAIGWRRGRGIFREIGAGILGYIAGLPLLLCATAIAMVMSRYAGKVPVHPMLHEITRGPLYLLVWSLLACIWAPVVEETLFRGVLFGYLRRHFRWAVSGIGTALLFALVHPQGWLGVPMIAAIGFTLSAIREWRSSLIASMSAHALNNGSALLLLILALS